MTNLKTASALKKAASVEYQRAVSCAKGAGWKHMRSRGQAFLFCGTDGRVAHPNDEPMEWNGTIGMMNEVLAEAQTISDCTHVVLEGGLDGFETVADLMESQGFYEPGIEFWCVTVWEKNEGAAA